jgi:type I restriction enzyme S subunit
MSFPRYESYKDSDVEWLGEVPAHWAVKRLGFFFNERREKVSDKDYEPLSVTKNGILPQLETAAKTDDGDNRKKVCAGDFVINSRSDRKGSSGLANQDGSVSLINTVLTPFEDINGRFAHHLLRSPSFQEEFYRYGKGIVADLWSTNYSEMKNILLAIPSVHEQQIIAAFLDRETAKIDALIAEQQRLIELLKEKRQAVISQAVTKGLNPDAPMKDSGIEWLGDVPAHWELVAFRRVAQIEEGQVSPTDENFSDWILIAPNHIESGTGRILSLETAADQGAISGKYRVRAGEVIYSKIRPALNKVCLAEIDCLCSADMYPIRIVNSLSAEYLVYLMLSQSFVKLMVDESMRVAMPKVNRDTLYGCRIVVPPLEEQESIIAHIHSEAGKYDALTAEAQRTVALLQERRAALISAAVTGKIDVRSKVSAVALCQAEAAA